MRFNWIEAGEPILNSMSSDSSDSVSNQDLVVAIVISSLLTLVITLVTTMLALKYFSTSLLPEPKTDTKRLIEASR